MIIQWLTVCKNREYAHCFIISDSHESAGHMKQFADSRFWKATWKFIFLPAIMSAESVATSFPQTEGIHCFRHVHHIHILNSCKSVMQQNACKWVSSNATTKKKRAGRGLGGGGGGGWGEHRQVHCTKSLQMSGGGGGGGGNTDKFIAPKHCRQ